MLRAAPSYRGLTPASRASSRSMQGNRATGTEPERLLAMQLRKLGLRGRKNASDLPGKPDMTFGRARVAVFCDGDFWHGRNWSKLRKRLSQRTNSTYWLAKIAYNMQRDFEQRRALQALGWRVLRFWESDILTNPHVVAGRVYAAVHARTSCHRLHERGG
jgi:DNA mismatch endonuclease, patch repair protein